MANVTRIKAKDSSKEEPDDDSPAIVRASVKSKPDKKTTKANKKQEKAAKKSDKPEKKLPLPLRVVTAPFRPFKAFGRYVHNSWLEIRQVRWPNRKLTWKLTFAMLVYTAIFVVFIMLLDVLFTFVFNQILG
jgi:preprotein translocase SecE subunit